MEINHVSNTVPTTNHLHVDSTLFNANSSQINSLWEYHLEQHRRSEFRKLANSFRLEIGDVTSQQVQNVGRRLKMYESQLWSRVKVDERIKFKCHLCSKMLCHFWTLRNHMFLHLEVYPFKCISCDKKYPSNASLYCHNRFKHNLSLTFSVGQIKGQLTQSTMKTQMHAQSRLSLPY